MILFWKLKASFKIENLEIEDDNEYVYTNGTSVINYLQFHDFDSFYIGFSFSPFFCFGQIIALIGDDFPKEIENKLKDSSFLLLGIIITHYNSLEELNNYIQSDNYEANENFGVCFGISYKKEHNKYLFKLHYFASPYSDDNTVSIPSTTIDNLDSFRTQPDFKSYKKYIESGFLMVQKIIYDYILQKETSNPNAEINLRIIAQKYDKYLYSVFNDYLSMLFGFFVLIAYALPLSINIYKLVKEKETRAKEGMKIMGLNEFVYFLSYFTIYFIINIIYAICNCFIIS